MIRSLKFLQANLNRSRNVQNALHNDEALEDFTAILGQEPSSFISKGKVVLPGTGRHWVGFTPPPRVENAWPVRSCIWVRKDVSALQVPLSCADITAVMLTIDQRRVLVASVYFPPNHAIGVSPSECQEQMRQSLRSLAV